MTARRDFLKIGAAAAALPALPLDAGAKSLITVAKGAPSESVRKCIERLGGMGKFVKQGARVVIKPNMGFPNPPEWGTTTHPEVVRAVAELCLESGARRVMVLDNPLRDGRMCREKSGIGDILKDLKEVVIAMPDDPKFYQETPVPGARELKTTAVAREVLKCDCLINVPVAKSHSATGVSLGIKNLMGLVWDRQAFHEKMDLNRAIAEQLLIIKPALTVVSAIHCLLTRGPGGPGKVEKLDTVVAGTDPVAVDAYSVGLARWYDRAFTGAQVKYIKIAAEMGLGQADPANMEVVNL